MVEASEIHIIHALRMGDVFTFPEDVQFLGMLNVGIAASYYLYYQPPVSGGGAQNVGAPLA